MSRRRIILGDAGADSDDFEGFRFYRISAVGADGLPRISAFSRIKELKFYDGYDRTGTIYPLTPLTSDSGDAAFIVQAATVFDSNSQIFKAFDDTDAEYRAENYTAYSVIIEMDKKRLFRSMFLDGYLYSSNVKIKLEGSDTGLWSGEEVLIGVSGEVPSGYNSIFWNYYDDEYPAIPNPAQLQSRTETTLQVSTTLPTEPSPPVTIASFDWYLNGVFYSNTINNSITFEGLNAGTSYGVQVLGIDSNGLKGNLNDSSFFATDFNYIGIVYVPGAGPGLYTHYRIQGVNNKGNNSKEPIYLNEASFFTENNQGGTEYPATGLTSPTSEPGITINQGYERASYESWRAFNDGGGGWWTLSNQVPSDSWIELKINVSVRISSISLVLNPSQHKALGFKIYGGDGDELTLIGWIQNVIENNISVDSINQNL